MASSVSIIDMGSSTPFDFVNSTAIPIPISTSEGDLGAIIGEFGLRVESGAITNFVELKATIGVQDTGGVGDGQEVVLTIGRFFEFPMGAAFDLITSVQKTIYPGDFEEIVIAHTDGGVGNPIPPEYYAYQLYIKRIPGAIDSTMNVVGPTSFGGASYIKIS